MRLHALLYTLLLIYLFYYVNLCTSLPYSIRVGIPRTWLFWVQNMQHFKPLCIVSGVTNYKIGIFVTCPKVCGINITDLWTCHKCSSFVIFNRGECAQVPSKSVHWKNIYLEKTNPKQLEMMCVLHSKRHGISTLSMGECTV